MEPLEGVGVLKLLECDAKYSGWLKHQQKTSKKFKIRYCVIHRGCFYCFKEDKSIKAKEKFSLSGYWALPHASSDALAPEPFVFNLIGRAHNYQPWYTFSASSKRELEDWISHITEEIDLRFPAVRRGDAQDVPKDVHPYDEPKPKPDDFSFFDPEKDNSKPAPEIPRESPPLFIGPKLSGSKQQRDAPIGAVFQPKLTEGTAEPHTRASGPGLRRTPSNYEVPDTIPASPTKPMDIEYEIMNADPVALPSRRIEARHPSLSKHKSEQTQVDGLHDNAGLIRKSNVEELPESVLLPASVYQRNLDRDQSVAVLTAKKIDGMYLIRQGSNTREKDVISTYVVGGTRHFIIFESLNDGREKEFSLMKTGGPRFRNLADLIRYYYRNDLPTCPAVLRVPYR